MSIKKSREVYLLRHAESLQNVGFDKPNCGLSKNGIKQARKLKASFDLIIISPFLRCHETLRISSIKYKKLITCNLLREYKIDKCDFFHDEPFVVETEKQLKTRVLEFQTYIRDLLTNYTDNETILILGHHDFIQEWIGISLSNAEFYKLDNPDIILESKITRIYQD